MTAIQAQPWYSASCDAFVSADLYSICTFNPSIICHQFIRVPMPHQEKNSHDHPAPFSHETQSRWSTNPADPD